MLSRAQIRPFYLIDSDPDLQASLNHGIVAEGAVLANGRTVLIWLSGSFVHGGHPDLDGVEKIHGQNGKRKIVFIDQLPFKRRAPRTFFLERTEDVNGLSGTGFVAEGIEFSNGWCILNWLVCPFSDFWYPSYEDIQNIHGHEGKTKLVWETAARQNQKLYI
ncbi:hypothetical protein Pse7367_1247 [Thalassoporum mexicanum PCC 7367]|uniref:hypothetical protein n=1 Tax=Thalassoporum mexicanum TaxID=3457544 RepID=UPI00029FD75F|nr:hypothetical protein [Pseudanabaena sp. PCC 7367]AFY69541.1 hypothetical protein Pse7367_1247 [Pseudanabaena sp. PCC 7367]